MGLTGIPHPIIFGIKLSLPLRFLVMVGLFCALSLWITNRIVRSPFGRVLKSIREDEVFPQTIGKNISKYKLLVFVFGSGMAAISGVIYAYYISFIDPTSFTVMESIFILSMVIIGGAGSLWGPVLGAVILIVFPEFLRFIGFPNSVAANIRQIFYGGLLVVFMIWRSRGFLGEYDFRSGESRK